MIPWCNSNAEHLGVFRKRGNSDVSCSTAYINYTEKPRFATLTDRPLHFKQYSTAKIELDASKQIGLLYDAYLRVTSYFSVHARTGQCPWQQYTRPKTLLGPGNRWKSGWMSTMQVSAKPRQRVYCRSFVRCRRCGVF